MQQLANRVFWIIYSLNLWEAAILALVLSLLWSLAGRVWERKPIWRGFNAFGTICITGAILYGTLIHRNLGTRELFLAPFQSFAEAKVQPEIYRSTLMNVILFMPFGLTVPYILPLKWKKTTKVCLVVLAGLVLSVVVEWCQYHFALGRCETDDVIMNTLGTALGVLAYGLCGVRKKKN